MSYKSPGTSNWNEGNFEEGLHEQTRSRKSSFNDISYIHVILNVIKIRISFFTKKDLINVDGAQLKEGRMYECFKICRINITRSNVEQLV